MKSLLLLAVACLALVIIEAKQYDLNKHPRALFQEYLLEFPQVFATEKERQERFQIFVHNVQDMKRMNEKHAGQATFGPGRFSLLTKEEFKSFRGVTKTPRSWTAYFGANMSNMMEPFTPAQIAAAPTSVDWRTHKPPVVTQVKDQGSCGDCWAFSTTGNVEGQWALAPHPLVSLSEQQLTDCDHVCIDGQCDDGCNGGLMANAMTYIIKNKGIESEADYPFKGEDGKCKFNAAKVAVTISSFKMLPHNADQMATFVASGGPLSIAVDAETWQNYQGGIIKSNCGTQLDHGVLIVGYGVSNKNIPFWIIKNSWGKSWGEQGYLMVERENDLCGINKYPITSVV